jgi:hypothetical protein
MTELLGRAPCSAVTKVREFRSFVAIGDDEKRVVPHRSCTPERLHT